MTIGLALTPKDSLDMTPKTRISELPDFDMAESLWSKEDMARYLSLVLEAGDAAELTHALGVVAQVGNKWSSAPATVTTSPH